MRILSWIMGVCLLMSAFTLLAQNPAATQTAPAGTVRLSGTVTDSTGGVMQAVNVRVLQGERVVATGVTSETGVFTFNVPPGSYRVEVTAIDFKTETITAQAAATMQPLAVTMTLAALEGTKVDVASRTNEVGVDPDASLTTQTLTGDDLLDLPDNEDDLLLYLQNLAARVGGAEAAEIMIDGFTEGQLPSREQIAEIRIVNNTFDAGGAGGGPRIEIITRSGTGRWRGNFTFGFRDESLNAANAFTGKKPPRQSRDYTTSVDGPVIKNKLTMGFRVQASETEGSAQSVRAITENGEVTDVLSSPNVRKTYGIQNARYSITSSNTLNFSGSITRNEGHNQGVNGFNLRSRAADTDNKSWQVQVSDRATLSSAMIHEARFQATRNNNSTIPVSDALAINVADAFTSGGGSNRRNDQSTTYQAANTLTWQLMKGKVNLRMGNELNYRQNFSSSQTNYNGTYYFSSLHDYCWAINFNGTNCVVTQAIVNDAIAAGTTPMFLNAQNRAVILTGIPTRYTRTFGDPDIDVSQAEFSTYAQADWRLSPRAQLQTGLRYQVQQHLSDYNNFGPTLGLNYQLRNSQNWRTVVRVGGRMTNQTFSMGNWQQLLQSDGVSRQFNLDILNPTFDPVNGPPTDGTSATGSTSSIRKRADNYTTGYGINLSATWEQSLPKLMNVSFTFDRTRNVHNNRNRNINAPYPGTRLDDSVLALLNSNNADPVVRAAERAEGRALVDQLRPMYPFTGNVIQMEPTGNSISKRTNVNFRTQNRNYLGGRINVGGNVSYSYSWGYDDNNPVNLYDIAADWGLSNRQHRIQGQAQLNIYQNSKWKNFRISMTPTWNSGSLYSITLGRDENGDSSTNDRPFGISKNTETGPSRFNMNMSISKTFYLGIGGGTTTPSRDYAEPQGGGGFGGGGGGGRGGGNVGGFGRNQRGTQMTISANINNVLNNTQLGNYSGVLTSTYFGRANTSTSERSISLQLRIQYQ